MEYPCTYCETGRAPYACSGDCEKKQAYKRLQSQAEYMELAKIAFDMVLKAMQEGEQTHGKSEWKNKGVSIHMQHASDHIEAAKNNWGKDIESGEDNIAHCITRLAMIRWKEMRQ